MIWNRLVVNFENIETIIPISAENRSFYFLQQNNELIYRWRFGEINVSDSLNQKFKSIRATTFDEVGNLWLIDTFGLHKIEFKRLFTHATSLPENEIEIFPNPASDYLNISGFEGLNYQLFNTHGALIQSGTCNSRINVSDLPKGIYYLRVEEMTARFVKE